MNTFCTSSEIHQCTFCQFSLINLQEIRAILSFGNFNLQKQLHWHLCYPTLYYPNFQLSEHQPILPVPFKPVILDFLLSDRLVTPSTGLNNRGSTVFVHITSLHRYSPNCKLYCFNFHLKY